VTKTASRPKKPAAKKPSTAKKPAAPKVTAVKASAGKKPAGKKPLAIKHAALKHGAHQKPAAAAAPTLAYALRERLQLKQPEFAQMLAVSPRTIATLDKGEPATEGVARRLTELERLTQALSEVMRTDSIGPWLKTPNTAFDGLKPLEVIERGQSDRLWEMVYVLRSGVPS
jgi:DNA-binding transcriptional regulator YiaG